MTSYILTDTDTGDTTTISSPSASSGTLSIKNNNGPTGNHVKIDAYVGTTLVTGSTATFTVPSPCP